MPILKCPVSMCDFYIKVFDKRSWGKVQKAFVQHLLENHTPVEISEYLFNFISSKAFEEQIEGKEQT